MTHQLVSVVTPTYNAKKFLPQAVKSALSQTYVNIEVIVVDDGSTDGTGNLPILKDPRVHYFKIDHTGGPAMPRNVGIQNAKGDLIAFLDADDIWLPEKLERQVSLMKKGRFDFVSSDAIVIDESGKIVRQSYLGGMPVPSGSVFPSLYEGNFVITSSVLVRKLCLESAGPFVRSLEGAEDYDLWLRIVSRFRFGFLSKNLLLYRDCIGSHSDPTLARNYEAVIRTIFHNFKVANKLLGTHSRLRPFSLSRALALRFKNVDFGKYLRYKALAFWFFPWGTGGWKELWPEFKSIVKI